MRKFIRSPMYLRVRAVTGAIFAIFGFALVWQGLGFLARGNVLSTLPVFVMGIALVALGGFRIRDYLRWRQAR